MLIIYGATPHGINVRPPFWLCSPPDQHVGSSTDKVSTFARTQSNSPSYINCFIPIRSLNDRPITCQLIVWNAGDHFVHACIHIVHACIHTYRACMRRRVYLLFNCCRFFFLNNILGWHTAQVPRDDLHFCRAVIPLISAVCLVFQKLKSDATFFSSIKAYIGERSQHSSHRSRHSLHRSQHSWHRSQHSLHGARQSLYITSYPNIRRV